MITTRYTVYWTWNRQHPHSLSTLNMGEAMAHMESLRKNAKEVGNSAIVMACENADRVGEDGVDCVKDGKTPDGVDYTWNMSGRIGATHE